MALGEKEVMKGFWCCDNFFEIFRQMTAAHFNLNSYFRCSSHTFALFCDQTIRIWGRAACHLKHMNNLFLFHFTVVVPFDVHLSRERGSPAGFLWNCTDIYKTLETAYGIYFILLQSVEDQRDRHTQTFYCKWLTIFSGLMWRGNKLFFYHRLWYMRWNLLTFGDPSTSDDFECSYWTGWHGKYMFRISQDE